jgi:hypothetical protein
VQDLFQWFCCDGRMTDICGIARFLQARNMHQEVVGWVAWVLLAFQRKNKGLLYKTCFFGSCAHKWVCKTFLGVKSHTRVGFAKLSFQDLET